jgi:RNA polymerase sigma-70 factor (ECF subfamily)
LRFLEGMSVRETAEIMGKREDHVKVIQNRAINALRNMLPAC